MDHATAPDADGGLRELYVNSYARVVRVVAAAADSRDDAEEVVQEAFTRLVPVWGRVSHFDDPEAWVRKVAMRLLSNRRRRLMSSISALKRAPRQHEHAPAPTSDKVDLVTALDRLPVAQRQVLVLHYLVGLDVREVADELGVAIGTVKSRLARARAALAPLLREEDPDYV